MVDPSLLPFLTLRRCEAWHMCLGRVCPALQRRDLPVAAHASHTLKCLSLWPRSLSVDKFMSPAEVKWPHPITSIEERKVELIASEVRHGWSR